MSKFNQAKFKSTSDALNGIIWADDNCIVGLMAEKYYAEQPHLTVEVKELSNLD